MGALTEGEVTSSLLPRASKAIWYLSSAAFPLS